MKSTILARVTVVVFVIAAWIGMPAIPSEALILSATSTYWFNNAGLSDDFSGPSILGASDFSSSGSYFGRSIGVDETTNDKPNINQLHQFGVNEKQGVLLSSPVTIDGPDRLSSPLFADTTTLPADLTVDSHIIGLNTTQIPTGKGEYVMETVDWVFDGEILGVMSDMFGLLATNTHALFGLDDVTYFDGTDSTTRNGSSGGAGLEPQYTRDFYKILADGKTLELTMAVNEPGDIVRVLTRRATPVPEASTSTLLLTGIGLLALSGLLGRKVVKA